MSDYKDLMNVVNERMWPERTKNESLMKWGSSKLLGFLIFLENHDDKIAHDTKLQACRKMLDKFFIDFRKQYLKNWALTGVLILCGDLNNYYEQLKQNFEPLEAQHIKLRSLLAGKWWGNITDDFIKRLTVTSTELQYGKIGCRNPVKGIDEIVKTKVAIFLGYSSKSSINSFIKELEFNFSIWKNALPQPVSRNELLYKFLLNVLDVDKSINEDLTQLILSANFAYNLDADYSVKIQSILKSTRAELAKLSHEYINKPESMVLS